jgi:hypothetical protein
MNHFTKYHLDPWGLELVKKYPLIFTESDDSNKAWAKQAEIADEDYVNLRYGFECGEGWKRIIEDIAKSATELVTYLREHGHPGSYIHSCIVKEKFGELRWQGASNLPTELFRDLWQSHVSHLERRSASVCEVTGEFGITRRSKNGIGECWFKTLCTEKAMEQGYDLEEWEKKQPKPFDGAELDKVDDR